MPLRGFHCRVTKLALPTHMPKGVLGVHATAARKRGVHMGRKPKLTELQRRVARERVAKGESARSIAKEWGLAHTTVARAVA
jgi:hypothetical protein